MAFSFFNKNTLFLLFNFVILLTLVIDNFSGTSVTNDDDRVKEEFVSYQSNAIIVPGDVPDNFLIRNDELAEEKSVILVEKYAKEEEHGEEEEIILDCALNKELADTGWRRNPIQKSAHRLELFVTEDLVPVPDVKEIVCVDKELDVLNRKCKKFIDIQKRTWRSDAAHRHLQLVKI